MDVSLPPTPPPHLLDHFIFLGLIRIQGFKERLFETGIDTKGWHINFVEQGQEVVQLLPQKLGRVTELENLKSKIG